MAAGSEPIYVVCPRCGSPDVVCDATATWDFETQDWTLNSTFDERTCQTCDYESHSFDATPVAMLTPPQLAFINDGGDYAEDLAEAGGFFVDVEHLPDGKFAGAVSHKVWGEALWVSKPQTSEFYAKYLAFEAIAQKADRLADL